MNSEFIPKENIMNFPFLRTVYKGIAIYQRLIIKNDGAIIMHMSLLLQLAGCLHDSPFVTVVIFPGYL